MSVLFDGYMNYYMFLFFIICTYNKNRLIGVLIAIAYPFLRLPVHSYALFYIFFASSIIGDELLLKFWREISAIISNFACESTKLPWQPSERLSVKMATKF